MVQVTVSEGILEGELVQDEVTNYFSFKGIPYAAPPVGELRFKVPKDYYFTASFNYRHITFT